MKIIVRLSLGLVCIGILLFCCFGFLATFEPLARSVQLTWRAVYSAVAILAVTGVVLLSRPRR